MKKNRKIKATNPYLIGAFLLALFSFTMLTALTALNIKSLQIQAEASRRMNWKDYSSKGVGNGYRDGSSPKFMCTMDYSPVCGSDGTTYSNECHANNASVSVQCKGTCPCGSNPISSPEPVSGGVKNPAPVSETFQPQL